MKRANSTNRCTCEQQQRKHSAGYVKGNVMVYLPEIRKGGARERYVRYVK